MRKRGVYLILVVLVVAGVFVVVFAGRQREPEYGGKRLSEWVRQYGIYDPLRGKTGSKQADDALRTLGGRAVPLLVTWLSYDETPPWKTRLFKAVNLRLVKLNQSWKLADTKAKLAEDAAICFAYVGPEANRAIPQLTKLVNDA